jgi:pyridoxal phosphate enzyme (YggS family)
LSAADALAKITTRMRSAAAAVGRTSEPQLVAVSKTFEADAIRPFLDAGQRVFGENRVQEAKGKWPELRAAYAGVELHLVGPLQTNKVLDALEVFDVIQTVDRDKLAAELAKAFAKGAPERSLLVQVNTGQEPQKAGVPPEDAVAFVARCREVHGLKIDGLMCIPPAEAVPGPHFALLDELAKQCGVSVRSMGMSGDFEDAVMNGATHIRVGSALFGTR